MRSPSCTLNLAPPVSHPQKIIQTLFSSVDSVHAGKGETVAGGVIDLEDALNPSLCYHVSIIVDVLPGGQGDTDLPTVRRR